MSMKDKNLNGSIRWTGCSDNVLYGTEIARKFVNLRERRAKNRMNLLNIHNNQIGIQVNLNISIFN
jgi:wingless-type MMTV integration site family protein 2